MGAGGMQRQVDALTTLLIPLQYVGWAERSEAQHLRRHASDIEPPSWRSARGMSSRAVRAAGRGVNDKNRFRRARDHVRARIPITLSSAGLLSRFFL